MIKVVHVITGLTTGGAEMMLYKLLSVLDRSRFEPVVISLMNKGTLGQEIEALGIPVYTVEMSQGKLTVSAIWRLIKLIRLLLPDVIQGWMYHGNLAASISRFLSFHKAPVLWNIRHSMHGIKYEKRSTALVILMCVVFSRSASKIIYNSKIGSEQHKQLGYASNRAIVIPNGFDCDRFRPYSSSKAWLRQYLNINETDLVIGMIGRYHPQKNHENLLAAAGKLLPEYQHLHFVLIGPGVDPVNTEISGLISINNLNERIHLLGERKDVAELIAGMDIVVSSSSYGEAFPNVIGEAMACAVPCVVTDVGDSAWIVGKTGKVVPPRNAEALANSCRLLIDAGSEYRMQLGLEARQRVLENFTLDRIVHQYELLYEGVISDISLSYNEK